MRRLEITIVLTRNERLVFLYKPIVKMKYTIGQRILYVVERRMNAELFLYRKPSMEKNMPCPMNNAYQINTSLVTFSLSKAILVTTIVVKSIKIRITLNTTL